MRSRWSGAALAAAAVCLAAGESPALSVFHSPSDSPADRRLLAPAGLPVSAGLGANLNLWVDPEGDTLLGFSLVVKANGSLRFDFSCAAQDCVVASCVGGSCATSPVVAAVAADEIRIAGGDDEAGEAAPFKVGTFVLGATGVAGDTLTLTAGSFLRDGSFGEGSFAAVTIAQIVPLRQAQSKDQQKCVVTLNKAFAKVAKAQAKDIVKCIKNGGKGKIEKLGPAPSTIESCTRADAAKKVAKAKNKTRTKATAKCIVPPGFGAADPNTVNRVAVEKELALIRRLFGPDLDAVIVPPKDPNTPDAKLLSKCQLEVAKLAGKCQNAKLKAFNKCKKNGLKGKDGTPILSFVELRDRCLGEGLGGIPDPKMKIKKACDTKMNKKLTKKCSALDYATILPGECGGETTTGGLAVCIDRLVECETCLALNAVDGLDRDCDLFDDGIVNASCP